MHLYNSMMYERRIVFQTRGGHKICSMGGSCGNTGTSFLTQAYSCFSLELLLAMQIALPVLDWQGFIIGSLHHFGG